MSRPGRLVRGVRWGATLLGFYYVADLAGTFLAIHWLFDPTLDAVILLLVAGAVTIGLGALAGGLLGLLWPGPLTIPTALTALLTPKRTRALAALLLAGTVATAYGARRGRNLPPLAEPTPAAASGPPILWLVIDTLRADRTYGPSLTFDNAPMLGRFAERALTFTDAEATAGWTIPSTAALLTGIHNVVTDASAGRLPDWAPTIAERLSQAGYDSHAVIDNVVLEPRNGFGDGFSSFFQRSGYRFAFSLPAFRLLPDDVTEFLRQVTVTSDYGAAGSTDAALEILASRRDRPLFLYVHYMDPHGPYYPHAEFEPPPPDGEQIWFWRYRDRLRKGNGPPPSPAQMKLLEHLYAGEIRYVDQHLGRLLEAWRAAYGERSLVMITSDHGEEFLEHGNLSHSLTVYRELIHVPLLLRLPAGLIPAERTTGVIETPVSLLDLMPTTLEAAGLPADLGPSPVYGQSLIPWLRGEAPPSRPLIGSHSRYGRRIFRFREGPWVYLKHMYYDGRPTEEMLFDLRTDPGEQHSRMKEEPDLAAQMQGRFATAAQPLNAAKEASHREAVDSIDEGSLRALGYIQ